MSEWSRIEAIIKWAGKNTNSFAAEIGLNRTENLYQIKRGRNGISKNLVEHIVAIYPQLSRSWILIGEGEMFVSQDANVGGGEHLKFKENEGTPYFEGDNFNILTSLESCKATYKLYVPSYKDCDLALRVYTNIMEPKIPHGSIIFLKRIDIDSLLYGDTYMIITADSALLRVARRNPKNKNLLTLISEKANDDINLKISNIRQLYLVRGYIASL